MSDLNTQKQPGDSNPAEIGKEQTEMSPVDIQEILVPLIEAPERDYEEIAKAIKESGVDPGQALADAGYRDADLEAHVRMAYNDLGKQKVSTN